MLNELIKLIEDDIATIEIHNANRIAIRRHGHQVVSIDEKEFAKYKEIFEKYGWHLLEIKGLNQDLQLDLLIVFERVIQTKLEEVIKL